MHKKVQRTYMIPQDLDSWLDKWSSERHMTKSDVIAAMMKAVKDGGIEMVHCLPVQAVHPGTSKHSA